MDFQAFKFLRRSQCVGNRCNGSYSADIKVRNKYTFTQAIGPALAFESRNITLATVIASES